MPIDTDQYNAVARKGDSAGLAIATRMALINIAQAFAEINTSGKVDPKIIADIRKQADRCDEIFDALTGWRP